MRNFENLAKKRAEGCFICGHRPSDPAHIRSRGAGGPDEDWNLLAMCRRHHTEQHKLGFKKFASKYLSVALKLESLGWEISDDGKLWNDRLRGQDKD